MARKQARPSATNQETLDVLQRTCRACGSRLQMARHGHRKVTTLQGVYRLTVKLYRCENPECARFHRMCRPEEEGGWALPHGEFGLDVIALVGMLRYQQQRSIAQIHEELQRRGLQLAERTVTDQLYRYEELLALHLADQERLQERLKEQEQVILALDGLQPDVGHEVLGVLRDCGSGEVLVARRMPGSDGGRPGSLAGRSGKHLPETGYPHRRRDHRWTTLHPQRGGTCSAGGYPPTLSLPLFA